MFIALIVATAIAQPGDLKTGGLYGFPQARAVVLCDTPDLRFSAYNDDHYLYLQAVLWNDGEAGEADTADGRKIGDWCDVQIDADADGKATGQVDRDYSLNPWPQLPGLHYSTVIDENSSSGLVGDSKGHGRTMYPEAGGKTVRVDSLLIPLDEIGRHAGDAVRFCYWGSSAVPALTVNSVGFTRDKPYYSFHLPREKWHTFTLGKGNPTIDIQAVPEGRGTIAVKAAVQMPKVGTAPPEVSAADWINWHGDAPPSLASLRGKVVVVEFWATWCAPCVEGIPHLNTTQEAMRDKGVVILSLTDQAKPYVAEFMKKTPMHYTVGAGSETSGAYGVTGIPHAFIIGRGGLIAWEGHPALPAFDEALAAEAAK